MHGFNLCPQLVQVLPKALEACSFSSEPVPAAGVTAVTVTAARCAAVTVAAARFAAVACTAGGFPAVTVAAARFAAVTGTAGGFPAVTMAAAAGLFRSLTVTHLSRLLLFVSGRSFSRAGLPHEATQLCMHTLATVFRQCTHPPTQLYLLGAYGGDWDRRQIQGFFSLGDCFIPRKPITTPMARRKPKATAMPPAICQPMLSPIQIK